MTPTKTESAAERRKRLRREWQKNNPDKVAIHRQKYLEANRSKLAQKTAKYRKLNPDKAAETAFRMNLKKAGLTLREFEQLLLVQKGRCAICCKENRAGHRLCVDHSHSSGAVRGLLCHDCNRGIGLLGDSSARLRAAAKYLESYTVELSVNG